MITDQGRCHSLGSIDTFLETNGQPEKGKPCQGERSKRVSEGTQKETGAHKPTTTHNPLTHAQKQISASAIAYLHFKGVRLGGEPGLSVYHL